MTTIQAAYEYARQMRNHARAGVHIKMISTGHTDRFTNCHGEDYAVVSIMDDNDTSGSEIELVFRNGSIYQFANGHRWSDDSDYSPSIGVDGQRPHIILYRTFAEYE